MKQDKLYQNIQNRLHSKNWSEQVASNVEQRKAKRHRKNVLVSFCLVILIGFSGALGYTRYYEYEAQADSYATKDISFIFYEGYLHPYYDLASSLFSLKGR